MSEHNSASHSHSAGRRSKKKKQATQRLAILVLGFLAALVLIIVLLIKIFVKPPDVTEPEKPVIDQPGVNTELPPGEQVGPAIKLERKEDYYTFLICGTDMDKSRTDTIMVASYDVKSRAVQVVSLPRDTVSNCNRKLKKLNAAFTTSIEALELEVEKLLGIPIDRYVVVDFKGFEEVIDAIGGVTYTVPMDMYHEDGLTVINLKKGKQLLNGSKALQLMRYRAGYADQDLGRIHVQQDFIKTVAKQLLSPSNLLNITDIAEAVFDNTKTNLTLGEMAWFASNALGLKMDGISFATLPGESQYLYHEPLGYNQWYYVPNEPKILELVNSGLNPYTTAITDLDLMDMTQYTPGK